MRDTWPLLRDSDFPALERDRAPDTLQLNLTYRCNLSCVHCHVGAGPRRREQMSREMLEAALALIDRYGITTLDLTGGSPEMHPDFRWLVREARVRGVLVMDRLNATIIEEPGYEWVAEFLADNEVKIVASLPCYSKDNVDAQRGDGVFEASIRALRKLNALGYGQPGSGRELSLVYNPSGPALPPPQEALEADYRRLLGEQFGIVFSHLFTLANMPIQRFGAVLLAQGTFDSYRRTLRNAHRSENLDAVMCRGLISVGPDGVVYDCDFNQMLGLPAGGVPLTLAELAAGTPLPAAIRVADHCYGCTAGQGSSCGGALVDHPA